MKPTFRKFTILLGFFCTLGHLRIYVTSEDFAIERFGDVFYNEISNNKLRSNIVVPGITINPFYVQVGIILCTWMASLYCFCKNTIRMYKKCVRQVKRFRRSLRKPMSRRYRNRRLVYKQKK